MRILILGGDGYLGWPTAMSFAARGHEVCAVDNYLRRNIAQQTRSESLILCPNLHDRSQIFKSIVGAPIQVEIADCAVYRLVEKLVKDFQPEAVIHYAEQPSAPYSMMGFDQARLTLLNNIEVTFNIIWALINHAPDCQLVKLGTMGEYGTPNIDIEEGWLDVEHNGRSHKFLYPRQAGSLYHTSKILDTDMLWFYVRTYGLRVTDLMQGPVYGLETQETEVDARLSPSFHYDDIFGTVVNRFLVQAIAGLPLTVYGKGGQTRGYLNIKDTLQCVGLAVENPVQRGELRILNQFTEQFTVNELAIRVRDAARHIGLRVEIANIQNPRKELEGHYYNAKHSGFMKLGLEPSLMTEDVLVRMLQTVGRYKDSINTRCILPRVAWNG